MPSKVFVDTAGWANLFVSTEPYHRQATQWFSQARKKHIEMVITNYVLLELIALLNLRIWRGDERFLPIDVCKRSPLPSPRQNPYP